MQYKIIGAVYCNLNTCIWFFIYASCHLGFRHFGHFPDLENNANPFFLFQFYQTKCTKVFYMTNQPIWTTAWWIIFGPIYNVR